jgi:hypothetical protein
LYLQISPLRLDPTALTDVPLVMDAVPLVPAAEQDRALSVKEDSAVQDTKQSVDMKKIGDDTKHPKDTTAGRRDTEAPDVGQPPAREQPLLNLDDEAAPQILIWVTPEESPPTLAQVKDFQHLSRCRCTDCDTVRGVWHVELEGHGDNDKTLCVCNPCYNRRNVGHLGRRRSRQCHRDVCCV